MEPFILNYSDYKDKPINYPHFFDVKPTLDFNALREIELLCKKNKTVEVVFNELEKRLPNGYFNKIFSAQINALSYANTVFPAYRYILPETMMDDWLSIVDPHPKYGRRDHSLHQPLTAYIVSRLLGNGSEEDSLPLPESKTLLGECITILEKKINEYPINYLLSICPKFLQLDKRVKRELLRCIFYQSAMTAALFHDIGYPWHLINDMSSGIKEGDPRGGLMAGTGGIYESIKDRLLIYPFYAYSDLNRKHSSSIWDSTVIRLIDEAMKSTHGFPGAIGFLYLNDRTRLLKSRLTLNDLLFRFVTEWSAVAIMMHDMEGMAEKHPRFRFSFEADPLSALIAMADVIEEFNRPKGSFISNGLHEDRYRDSYVLLGYESPGVGVSVDASSSEMKIDYLFDSEENAKINRNRRIDEINKYFNGEKRFIDLRCLGINKVICSTKKI